MPKDLRETSRALPVIIGDYYEHVMGTGRIFRTTDKVLIQIEANGEEGQILADFLEQAEPIAMTFIAIPVQNAREKREKT